MATPALVVLSVLIFVMLLQLNAIVALLFFMTVIVVIPAVILEQREAAAIPELVASDDAESPLRGVFRLAQMVSADVTGVALGVLWLFFSAVLVIFLARVVFR